MMFFCEPQTVVLFQGVQGGRAKRYSSQRQRPVPEPAPPVHISIMEGHYYDTRKCALLYKDLFNAGAD